LGLPAGSTRFLLAVACAVGDGATDCVVGDGVAGHTVEDGVFAHPGTIPSTLLLPEQAASSIATTNNPTVRIIGRPSRINMRVQSG